LLEWTEMILSNGSVGRFLGIAFLEWLYWNGFVGMALFEFLLWNIFAGTAFLLWICCNGCVGIDLL